VVGFSDPGLHLISPCFKFTCEMKDEGLEGGESV
jgi:hypothetical protein